jgi:hypothetical protein
MENVDANGSWELSADDPSALMVASTKKSAATAREQMSIIVRAMVFLLDPCMVVVDE